MDEILYKPAEWKMDVNGSREGCKKSWILATSLRTCGSIFHCSVAININTEISSNHNWEFRFNDPTSGAAVDCHLLTTEVATIQFFL